MVSRGGQEAARRRVGGVLNAARPTFSLLKALQNDNVTREQLVFLKIWSLVFIVVGSFRVSTVGR